MEVIKLFRPIKVNQLIIKNRTAMPAMALFYTNDYTFSERYQAFYRERAKGGVGLMIIGPVGIDRVGSPPFIPALSDDRYIAPIRKFNDELHRDTDAKLGTQLMHMGYFASSRITGEIPIAPSAALNKLTGETAREMTKEDIEDVKEAFAQGARRAKEAGFDYVEIIAGGGYLISGFLSPITNRRTDEYGGSIENRMRFGLEVIGKVREAVGQDFAIGIRVAGHDFMEGGHTNKESSLFCCEAEKAGIDAISMGGGWHISNVPQITIDVPPGAFLYLSRGIKEKVGVPVFVSHRLGDPFVAERALRSGAADVINWGRPLLVDPELPMKVREGRFHEIVQCIACNQGCLDSIFSGSPVYCVLNPRLGREADTEIKEAKVKRKIFVAGGGPAGMEVALIATQRGHHVTLYEKEEELGGQINLAAASPNKKAYFNIIKSLKTRMDILGTRIELKTPLTSNLIERGQPDVLVVATGARPAEIDVPGVNQPHVVNAWDVLIGKIPDIGKNVVIVGGSSTGCETAYLIAREGIPNPEVISFLLFHSAEEICRFRELLTCSGRRITVIDMLERLANNMGPGSRWPLMKNLRLLGVELRSKTKLVEITGDAVIVETAVGRESIPADTVILAVGARPIDDLAREVKASSIEVITIGDAKEPRRISEAIGEGFDTAMNI